MDDIRIFLLPYLLCSAKSFYCTACLRVPVDRAGDMQGITDWSPCWLDTHPGLLEDSGQAVSSLSAGSLPSQGDTEESRTTTGSLLRPWISTHPPWSWFRQQFHQRAEDGICAWWHRLARSACKMWEGKTSGLAWWHWQHTGRSVGNQNTGDGSAWGYLRQKSCARFGCHCCIRDQRFASWGPLFAERCEIWKGQCKQHLILKATWSLCDQVAL